MNFLVDESVDHPVVMRLREDGHVVLSVAEKEPSISDDKVLSWANEEGALLLTADKDFGELVFRLHQVTTGVVLIRLEGLSLEIKADIVSRIIQDHSQELPGAFTVISPGIVRIRPHFG